MVGSPFITLDFAVPSVVEAHLPLGKRSFSVSPASFALRANLDDLNGHHKVHDRVAVIYALGKLHIKRRRKSPSLRSESDLQIWMLTLLPSPLT